MPDIQERPPGESRYQQRLTLLVRAGEIFHRSLDVDDTLDNVARLVVESFADICLFDLLDDRSERLFVTAAAHHDRSKEELLSRVATLFYIEDWRPHPVVQVTRTGKPFFVSKMDEKTFREHAASLQHERYMREFGYRSKIVVPVIAQDHIFGALTFVRTRDESHFEEEDLVFAIELGRRAGLAVANAKQFNREHNVAETLQRAFLPDRLALPAGLEVTACYRPGSTEADIGGDWYDAFETSTGKILVVIGDVAGKGVEAARLMILLRQSIRIAALDTDDPRLIARMCNRLLLVEKGDKLATAFIGIIDPQNNELCYVSAGHTPPFLVTPSDAIIRLQAPSEPLGALPEIQFASHKTKIPSGSMLVMFTDGVIELNRDVLAGEKMLQRVLASRALWHSPNPAQFIERAIGDPTPRDDLAIMVVTFGKSDVFWQFEASDARAAYSTRERFFKTIRNIGITDSDQISACALIYGELIGNCVRHAPGPVSISVEATGNDVVLHVLDNGPGFLYNAAMMPNLWSENGRGLFLVSRLARNVRVEQMPGSGSHIAVTLPMKTGSRAANTIPEARHNPVPAQQPTPAV